MGLRYIFGQAPRGDAAGGAPTMPRPDAGPGLLPDVRFDLSGNATPAKVASIWNAGGRTTVSDFGARVGRTYLARPWADAGQRR